MDTHAATLPVPALDQPPAEEPRTSTGAVVLLLLAGVTAVGLAVRFASLGLQSFHHDEVITVMRVIPGSFADMLHRVETSESNPPLYYALAWGWAKAFGSGEFGIRSLSALFGAATVPVGYLIGRQLADRRAGLILAALIAVNPMLIWYSQEARSYALLVFFGALSFLFFARALDSRRNRDLGLWALASVLALWSHYFAFFVVGIEALWLLVALRAQWRRLLPALVAVGAAGLALVPLISGQVNPTHIGWIENSPLPTRLLEGGVSFLIGETGHVIAEPPRDHYALAPAIAVGIALLLVLFWGDRRERRGRRCRRRSASGWSRWPWSPPWSARTTWSSATCCRRWFRSAPRPRLGSAPGAPAGSARCWRSPSAPTGSPSTSTSPRHRTSSAPTTRA